MNCEKLKRENIKQQEQSEEVPKAHRKHIKFPKKY